MMEPAMTSSQVTTWKKTVGHDVELEAGERFRRLRPADHVMPLKDLAQHDAVDESAEPQPEQEAGQHAGLLLDHGAAIPDVLRLKR